MQRWSGSRSPLRPATLWKPRWRSSSALFPESSSKAKSTSTSCGPRSAQCCRSGPGRFSFTWAGKDDAIALLQTPSHATLVPCPEESVNFDATGNAFIEGDNLEVLKLLFKPYFGRVKLIYIDPPYNTGQDFVYPDNYADPLKTYLQLTGQMDAEGNLLTSNPETSGRYHSAWLSMMYPRLFLARQLLREDGVIFVSIDDHEVHHLRMLMNEVFGEENFVAQSDLERTPMAARVNQVIIVGLHEYVLVFPAENRSFRSAVPICCAKTSSRCTSTDDDGPKYDSGGYACTAGTSQRMDEPRCNLLDVNPKTRCVGRANQGQWSRSLQAKASRPQDGGRKKDKDNWSGRYRHHSETRGLSHGSSWSGQGRTASGASTEDDGPPERKTTCKLFGISEAFDTPKPVRFDGRSSSTTGGNDIVLDFFAGSAPPLKRFLS